MMACINTQRIDHVNTLRIDTGCITTHMQQAYERLRAARIAAGYSSASKAAEAFGWKESSYRSHENGTRAFDVDMARRYARAFKIPIGELLALDLISPANRVSDQVVDVEIVGKVAAGVWREPDDFEEGERRTAPFGPSPYPHARRFALEVVGHSMDRVYPPGTLLDCLSIYDLEIDPLPGDHVIVERSKPDGRRELTVKRFDLDDEGRPWLIPESTKPEFQAPIRVDDGEDDDLTVQVIAFVIGHYSSRAADFASRRRRGSVNLQLPRN